LYILPSSALGDPRRQTAFGALIPIMVLAKSGVVRKVITAFSEKQSQEFSSIHNCTP